MAGVRVTEQTPIRSRDHHKTAVKAKASREAVGDSIKALDEVAAIRANDKTVTRDSVVAVANLRRSSSPHNTQAIMTRPC